MTVHRAASRPTEYLTLQEAAERYHVSVMTLRRRIHSGALPAIHSGRRLIRIPDSALEQLFTPVPNASWWTA
ncbi:MAG: helix-turn-helix domain-containing protein [Propionibacteriaceae bacterium]|nr:helix-turn-helix domain-containing protein [Propionibacteriaceae bacterium]